MRRYRFGRIAAPLALAYAALVVALGVVALVTRDPALLRRLVAGEWDPREVPFMWWVELPVVAAGLLQGWAYWQALRGRAAGTLTSRGRRVALLRAALYAGVVLVLVARLPIPYAWWTGVLSGLLQLLVVWLYPLVLAPVLPRAWRLVALVGGTLSAVSLIATSVAYWFDLAALMRIGSFGGLDEFVGLLWLVPVLVGQARDPRWSRTTVWMGAVSGVMSFVSPSSYSYMSVFGEVNYALVYHMLLGAVSVFGVVWEARSAHELANPVPRAPLVRPAPERAAARPWPLAAVAVALPLIPAAVNLAQGTVLWIGPRGEIERFLREETGSAAIMTWFALDVLVGVGAPAVLILVAVVRRTRPLLRVTTNALALAAVIGAVSFFTYEPDPNEESLYRGMLIYPEALLSRGEDGGLRSGVSPLWYAAALGASALILTFLYGAAPKRRPLHHLLAVAAALCVVPAADLARGPVTTAEDCSPDDSWAYEEEPPPPTGERAFVCAVRTGRTFAFAATTPDQVLLAHGRRLCDAYTRDDRRELARLRVNAESLASTLAGICPRADAAVKAERVAEDREFEEWEAEEQRKCDAAPRHRPLVPPARSSVLKEPEWPEGGLAMYEETDDGEDPAEVYAKAADNGLVASGPGHLVVTTNSDLHVCVTLETYTRRPPVETKGWDHVVEVGYRSSSGRMVLSDGLSGTELPDLSLHGRKGHYRIRVHFAWVPWKGDKYGTQRLLIMAYPANGDKVVTYRKPARSR
ncbi:hypothetical protein [Nonomuraea jabiensis]|uniref:Uncharacterized protein n=1 Tax=Nonomuraea jabiensis TaxID=882448 RepID=A0A7W9G8B7_9ACTN|nr:hypothetical protein [Nonomuraea jabiensis]MBB5779089.1 hypothetical protein [Nonomuraea jabiensis]